MVPVKLTFSEKVKKFFQLEPALLRGVLISLAAIIAKIFGATVIDDSTVNTIIDLFTSVSALLAVVWLRPVIVPLAKTLAYKPDPDGSVILSGNASTNSDAELQAAIIAVKLAPADGVAA